MIDRFIEVSLSCRSRDELFTSFGAAMPNDWMVQDTDPQGADLPLIGSKQRER